MFKIIKLIFLKCFKILKYFIFIIVPILFILYLIDSFFEMNNEKEDNLSNKENNINEIQDSKNYKDYLKSNKKYIVVLIGQLANILKNMCYKELTQKEFITSYYNELLSSFIEILFSVDISSIPFFIIKNIFGLDIPSILENHTKINSVNYENIKVNFITKFILFFILYFFYF